MTHADVQRWLDDYVEAWRTYDPDSIRELFAAEAEYRYRPSTEPVVGADAIVGDWLANRDAPGTYEARYSPWTVDGDRAVATGETRYVNPDGTHRTTFDNLFLLEFDREGRCRSFTELFVERTQPEG
ncbi:MAG: nuclear transport factor 2 family protein [Candidatus Limnocylindrales bacterium]